MKSAFHKQNETYLGFNVTINWYLDNNSVKFKGVNVIIVTICIVWDGEQNSYLIDLWK